MLTKRVLLLFIWIISYTTQAYGTVYGADYGTIQGQLTITGGDNRIANTAALDNGFNLTDNTTTCSFDSFYPVLGVINLNLGKLFPLRDMFLNDFFLFGTGGQVYGSGHTMSFPDTSSVQLPDTRVTKTLGAGAVSTQTMATAVNSVSWSYDDKYVAAGAAVGTGNLSVYPFSNNTLSAAANPITVGSAVNSLAWSPTNYYLAVGIASATNSLTVYQWNGSTLTFVAADRVSLATGVSAVAWSPNGKYLAVAYGTGATIAVQIYSYSGSGTLTAVGVALNYSTGSAGTAAPVSNALSWNSLGNTIAVGYVATAPAGCFTAILNFSGSALAPFTGSPYSFGAGNAPASVAYKPGNPNVVAIGLSSSTTRFRLYEPYLGAFTERWANTESINYNSVAWSLDGLYLATGLNTGATNLRIYYFPGNDSSGSSTTAAYKLSLISSITLGSAVATVAWTNTSDNYLAAGYGTTVGVFQISQLSTYRKALYLNSTNITLNSDMEMVNTTTFYGNCAIIGNGNTLTLNNATGNIAVASGGTLSFQNLNLTGLKNTNLQCLANNASIVFENCKLTFTSNFVFGTGSILFNQDVMISGTNKFSYTSVMGSTINKYSTLYLDKGLTFSYSPAGAYRNLIYMPDNSAWLVLDQCTLHVTRTGLQLITGQLFFENNVILQSEATASKSQAIIFGNGNSKNDLGINLLAGAQVNVSGRLELENVN
jgi:WD40 repeat protein